jgi:hypothetical protein
MGNGVRICCHQGIKLVPRNIKDFLTPLALAVWNMDGGSISSSGNGFRFATNSFYLICSFPNWGVK